MAAIERDASSVGQTLFENLSCDNLIGVLSVDSTMANSLITVVSYCMHCKVCIQICTSSTDYLYCLLAYDVLHSQCHAHTARPSCKTMLHSCVNHRQVPFMWQTKS